MIAHCRQPGFALPAAILAIVVLGAVLTGGFYAASQEGRIGTSSQMTAQAFYAAERGLHEVLGTYTRPSYEAISVDGQATIGPVTTSEGGIETSYTVTIRRLSHRLYYIESIGEVLGGGAPMGSRRQVAMFVRTRSVTGEFDQALRVFGQLTIGGNSRISGNDTIPAAWAGLCVPGAARPGLVMQDTTLLHRNGNAHRISGAPAVLRDPGMTLDDFQLFGDMRFEELAALAGMYGKVYGPTENETGANPGALGSACDTSSRSNWGAPTNAAHQCRDFMPIIYAEGANRTFTLGGNSVGQGILLVEGNLRISGTARFYGIIIVKGTFETGSGTSRVNGTVLVGSNGTLQPLDGSTVTGTPTVQYSSCAINRAQALNSMLSRAFPVVQRSWADLTLVREGI
jgi:hypothetical protein